jgi:hypothetical protein
MKTSEGGRLDRLALAQGLYFVATGVWPLVHYRSFERVTGPKVDVWLVKTVGALAAAIGTSLLLASRRARPSAETRALAVTSAGAFASIDVWYALRRRISPVYLADAALEAALATAWCLRSERPKG